MFLQLTEVGHKGELRITYEVEECEGSKGVVCIKGVTVSYKRDDEVEILSVFNDASMDFNGSPVSAVSIIHLLGVFIFIIYDYVIHRPMLFLFRPLIVDVSSM